MEWSPRDKARAARTNGDVHRQLPTKWLRVLPVRGSVLNCRGLKYLLFQARHPRPAQCQITIMFSLWCQFLQWSQSISTHTSSEGNSGCWGILGREWSMRESWNMEQVWHLHSKFISIFWFWLEYWEFEVFSAKESLVMPSISWKASCIFECWYQQYSGKHHFAH